MPQHGIVEGDIIESRTGQIVVPDQEETELGLSTRVRINSAAGSLNTDLMQQFRGLICFISPRFGGKGILAVRITKVGERWVRGEPVEYAELVTPGGRFSTAHTGIRREVVENTKGVRIIRREDASKK